MKILMVIGQFYPLIGGAERQCLKLSRALQARGHGVKVLTVWNPRTVPQHDMVEGIRVERVWYPILNVAGYRVGMGFLAPFFMLWRVYGIARKYGVVHVHQCLWPAFVAAVAGKLRGTPVICKLGNSGKRFDLDVMRRTHLYGRIAAWYTKRAVTKFIWTSKAVRDDLRADSVEEEKMMYIPNGVELPDPSTSLRFAQGVNNIVPEQSRRPTLSKTVFIFTGTFTLKKNLPVLLDAVNILPPRYRNKVALLLLGGGQDHARLTHVVKQYNLEDIVTIKGPVDDITSYLEKSDVFVLPSSTEGLSNSALEAMAYGRPVILSDRGGNRDLISLSQTSSFSEKSMVVGNTGILIDPTHVESLSDALRYMIDHPEEMRHMGERARALVEEKYAIEKVAGDYEELYQRVYKSTNGCY